MVKIMRFLSFWVWRCDVVWSGTSVRVSQRVYLSYRIIVLSSATLTAQALGLGYACVILGSPLLTLYFGNQSIKSSC